MLNIVLGLMMCCIRFNDDVMLINQFVSIFMCSAMRFCWCFVPPVFRSIQSRNCNKVDFAAPKTFSIKKTLRRMLTLDDAAASLEKRVSNSVFLARFCSKFPSGTSRRRMVCGH